MHGKGVSLAGANLYLLIDTGVPVGLVSVFDADALGAGPLVD